jgi:hypothetical protein
VSPELRAQLLVLPFNSQQLFQIAKRGFAEKWPTDKPEDLAIAAPIVTQRQASLDSIVAQKQVSIDSMIFEEELNAWVKAHWPSTQGGLMSIQEFNRAILTGALDQPRIARELRESAPITSHA